MTWVLWLRTLVIAWCQRRCPHPGHAVAFDVLEGSHEPTHVQVCRLCGACCVRYRITDPHNWQTVIPDRMYWTGKP
jgi:hypothetical protein